MDRTTWPRPAVWGTVTRPTDGAGGCSGLRALPPAVPCGSALGSASPGCKTISAVAPPVTRAKAVCRSEHHMKKLLLLAIAFLSIAFGVALGVFRYGIVPVNADVPPSALETRFIPAALRASVARRAEDLSNPMPPTEENLVAGREIYTEMCARRHGLP